ncbi:5-methyltetrahydropteroyltriglutamate--homocysteine S-methyltransferase, partial [Glutamicibacter creatinolyticus]
MSKQHFPQASILGYPRIGRRRELKKALEAHWAGTLTEQQLHERAFAVQQQNLERLVQLGLDPANGSLPGDHAYYDQVLDTLVALGAVPSRFAE